jgi:hypothetical protein
MYDKHETIRLKKGNNKIACLGDAHRGNPGHVEKQFNEAKAMIKKEKMNVVMMGDMIECREPSHPFYVPGAPTINDQMNWYCDTIDEFNDNGMLRGVMIGNHEHALIQKTSNNDIERYCKHVKVEYMDYMGVLDFDYDGYTYSVMFHHGAGRGTTTGGTTTTLMNFTKNFGNYDAVIMAHTHQLAALPPCITLVRDKKAHRNVDKYCYPAYTGSFFCTYKDGPSQYGEIKAYPPLPIGFTIVTLDDGLAQSRTQMFRIHKI